MKQLKITLRSDLCAGNGAGFGYVVDSDVCRDRDGYPYIPARRLKGCLREEAVNLKGIISKDEIDEVFGISGEKQGVLEIQNARLDDRFRNINPDELLEVRALTSLDEKTGCAKEETLRFVRVVKGKYNGESLVFTAGISCDGHEKTLDKLCRAFRHMGLNRTRGLGNISCSVSDITTDDTKKDSKAGLLEKIKKSVNDNVTIAFYVRLASPVIMKAIKGSVSDRISSRAVIGCMAGGYLRNNKADETFRKLFLDGTVKWSDLCVSDGTNVFYPAPFCLQKLKYPVQEDITFDEYVNQYSDTAVKYTDSYRKTQAKNMFDRYAAYDNGFVLKKPDMKSEYHHTRNAEENDKNVFYSQTSINEGQCFAGTVTFPKEMAETVCGLIFDTPLRFGMSRSAQYGSCVLSGAAVTDMESRTTEITSSDRFIYAVLKNSLLITDENGMTCLEDQCVGSKLNELLFDNKARYVECNSLVETAGGYNNLWNMPTPDRKLISGGSVYVFERNEFTGSVKRFVRAGSNLQEGCGLIEIMTQKEMNSSVTECKPDLAAYRSDAENKTSVLRQKAWNLYNGTEDCRGFRNDLTDLSASYIGRIQLMLKESDSTENFIKRVESVKDEKKRERILETVKKLRKKPEVDGYSFDDGFKPVFHYILKYAGYTIREEKEN